MYTKPYLIERFLTNQHNALQVGTLFHLFNDIMERNANSYGASAEYHLERDLAWVLAQYEVTIYQWPKADTHVTVGTIPYSFKRMMGYRKYEMRNNKGDLLMEGKGKFLLINIKTKAMVKPDASLLDKFTDAKKEPMALDFEKIRPKEQKHMFTLKRLITKKHIDVNAHMNNAYYLEIASEYLTIETEQIKKINVTYKQEAKEHDQITLNYYSVKDGIYVEMLREDTVLSQILFSY